MPLRLGRAIALKLTVASCDVLVNTTIAVQQSVSVFRSAKKNERRKGTRLNEKRASLLLEAVLQTYRRTKQTADPAGTVRESTFAR